MKNQVEKETLGTAAKVSNSRGHLRFVWAVWLAGGFWKEEVRGDATRPQSSREGHGSAGELWC